VVLGDASRSPVIFVHGMAGSAGSWLMQYGFWMVDRYHFVAYDQRGHGLSPPTAEGYGLARQADDLERVRLAHTTQPAIVVGYSYGGHIATQWVLRYPQSARGLVVIDTPPLPVAPEAIAELMHGVCDVLGGDLTATGELVDTIKRHLRGLIAEQQRPVRRMRARLETLRQTAFERDVLADLPFDDADYQRIACPALLIYATKGGNLAFADRQMRLIPDCRLRIVDAEHDLVQRNAAQVRGHLRDFLDGLTTTAGPAAATTWPG
jgi:pimeloyl-ACP methyl ester carboxylesterase